MSTAYNEAKRRLLDYADGRFSYIVFARGFPAGSGPPPTLKGDLDLILDATRALLESHARETA